MSALVNMRDPLYKADLEPMLEGFLDFMSERGAEIRDPTNEWEACRYLFEGTVSIIYFNKRGVLTYVNDSRRHIQEFGRYFETPPEGAMSDPRTPVLQEPDDECPF